MKKDRRLLYLDTYGESLTQLLKVYQYGIKIGATPEEAVFINHNVYLCPLCLKNFFYLKNEEFYENETFSEDHFPPKSVGGYQTALVCKPCNDYYGLKMDHALKDYLKFQAFLNKKENASYPLKFNYKGIPGTYGITTEWQNGNMIQNISFKNYPFIQKWATDINKKDWSFNMKITAPSQDSINKALLRTAYLFCFSNWGYDFAYSKTAEHIRHTLQDKEIHPLSNFGVFGDVSAKALNDGFYFISSPKKYQAFIIVFEIKLSKPEFSIKVFVVIPGADVKAWGRLKDFKMLVKKKKANMQLVSIYNDSIRRGNYMNYSITWSKLTAKQ